MIGRLQFIGRLTGLDILLAINILEQYSTKSNPYMMKSVKQVFGYLRLTNISPYNLFVNIDSDDYSFFTMTQILEEKILYKF